MEELQLIYLILQNKSLEPLYSNDLLADYFVEHKNILEFILKFNSDTMDLPSFETIASSFPEIEWPTQLENSEYLARQIKENYTFNEALKVINSNEAVLKSNSFEGVNKIVTGLNQLLEVNETNYESLLDRTSVEDNINVKYITTGFPLLDHQINGFRSRDELITVVGRTRMGKSWLLLKMLLENWKSGLNVGLYSGEMNKKDIADRFDTLNINRSNKEISEGLYDKDPTFREYKKALGDRDNKFILQTFKSLKRRANVRDIEAMIVKYKLNVIGIDQLSLMTDVRYQRGDNVKQSYDNISMDLFHLAEKYGVVIILLVQSNREAAKNNEVQLENIADSDDVAQNSSKVISLNRDQNNILTLKVLKNRYGPTGKDVKYIWDIDLGTFKELINDSVEALEGSDELFI